ncbi:MAG: hypothetical protein K8U03_16440 [Planctomycetia bacterium]|nr:hypothetical protein [Planctomycetia bacterium]
MNAEQRINELESTYRKLKNELAELKAKLIEKNLIDTPPPEKPFDVKEFIGKASDELPNAYARAEAIVEEMNRKEQP